MDVARLEVAVDDARLVRRFEAGGELGADGERLAQRQRRAVQPLGEALAGHVLEREIAVAVVVLADAKDARHVRVVNGG